jgi:hypothetical protein
MSVSATCRSPRPRIYLGVDDERETERLPRLTCDECGVWSDFRAVAWEAHLTLEDDDTKGVAFFCPQCVLEFRS